MTTSEVRSTHRGESARISSQKDIEIDSFRGQSDSEDQVPIGETICKKKKGRNDRNADKNARK
jgi:hypothetical protein